MKTIYKAVDGKVFKNYDECKQYENSILTLDNMKQALEFAFEFCSRKLYCAECPLYSAEYHECVLASAGDINGWNMEAIDKL